MYKLIIDLETQVSQPEHARYQAMERFLPTPGELDSGRRGKRGDDDPLTTARWPFQQIVTAVVMKCAMHDGNISPIEMITLSAPEYDEREILQGIATILKRTPARESEIVSYGGADHDIPLLVARSMRHGLTLPKGWSQLAFGGRGSAPQLDLLRVLTGGTKLKLVHMSEFAAVLDIPAKLKGRASSVDHHIRAKDWDSVQEMCEVDVITTALLYASWCTLIDGRCSVSTVHDRIYRKVEELRAGRAYIPTLTAKRQQLYAALIADAETRLEPLVQDPA